METCIDDVLRAPAAVAATDEAGPSGAFAGAAAGVAGDDPLSLGGEARRSNVGSCKKKKKKYF